MSRAADPVAPGAPALTFAGIGMDFPGVRALDDVSFTARAGSIHALLGENGAGKSTLLRILAGALRPTRGEVRIDGRSVVFHRPADALAGGAAVIPQEPQLVPAMSVAENLFLGHLPARRGLIDQARLTAGARRQLELVGEDLDPATPIGQLPLARRQMVEIAKALARGARILALDEPTSSLSEREVRRLFAILRELRARGCTLLYVSHRLEEIFALCDRATILRDGRHIETVPVATLTRAAVVERMVGRPPPAVPPPLERTAAGPGLAVEALSGPGLAAPCSFAVGAGELLGIFGLVGAGRSALLRLLGGATPSTGGTIRVAGRPVKFRGPRDALNAGVVLCPEDRIREGIIPGGSVLENLNLGARRRHAWGGMLIDPDWEQNRAGALMRRLQVRAASADVPLRTLSGGNQQKIVIGRWLSEDIRVLLLDEPTRGVDVGAKQEIHGIIRDLAHDGVCVVVVSSELPELRALSDRILVLREGVLAGELSRAEAREEHLLALALPAGARESAA